MYNVNVVQFPVFFSESIEMNWNIGKDLVN